MVYAERSRQHGVTVMLNRTFALRPGMLVLAAIGCIAMTFPVRAQMMESDHAFKTRMQGYVHRIEADIDRIRRDLDPEAEPGQAREPGTSTNMQESGALYELDQMEEALDQMERELNMMSLTGGPNDYERQRQRATFEYYLDSMDRRLRQLRVELNHAEKVEADAAAERAERQALEEEVSNDEDWAKDWARGED